jgi:hypothetical protein
MMRVATLVLVIALPAAAGDLQIPGSAETCGDCHREIQQGWKKSAHAQAMESRLFQDALKLAESELGASSRKVCLSCHSPLAVETNDLALVRKVSWEGVTCDYCHSIREVTLADANPRARVELSLVKSGPSKESYSPAHATVYSAVHTSSLACVSCHEYRNANGFPVLTTYSEWKNSSYAGGAKNAKDCQACHMYGVRGDVVDPRVQRPSQPTMNLHEIPGSRSVDQLNKAVGAQISTTRFPDHLQVTVRLTNRGAGHSVPTGSPLRQLILDLRVQILGGKEFHEERFYRRTVTDKGGTVLDREHLAFTRAAKELKDTRLAANESRNEIFSFPIRVGTQARVQGTLYYYYSPTAASEFQKQKFWTSTVWAR